MITWCTAPEIRSATDRIICHFGPFFALLTPNKPENQYFLKFFVILDHFLHLYPTKNFEKIKICLWRYHHLRKGAKKHDHMLYCSWDKAHERCNFYFSFWAIFCPFAPKWPKKLKLFKNEKNTTRYHDFTHAHQQLWSHDVRFLRNSA